MIYLDYAATTPVRKEVLEVMLPFFTEKFGNPSSQHELGRKAKRTIAKNREKIIMAAKRKHIQLGKIIEYSIPHLDAYKNYADEEFPNSLMCAEEAINLPIYPDLLAHREKQNYIIESLKNYG